MTGELDGNGEIQQPSGLHHPSDQSSSGAAREQQQSGQRPPEDAVSKVLDLRMARPRIDCHGQRLRQHMGAQGGRARFIAIDRNSCARADPGHPGSAPAQAGCALGMDLPRSVDLLAQGLTELARQQMLAGQSRRWTIG